MVLGVVHNEVILVLLAFEVAESLIMHYRFENGCLCYLIKSSLHTVNIVPSCGLA